MKFSKAKIEEATFLRRSALEKPKFFCGITTTNDFKIIGFKAYNKIFNFKANAINNKFLFDAFDINSSKEEIAHYKQEILTKGCWNGLFKLTKKHKEIVFEITCTLIETFDDKGIYFNIIISHPNFTTAVHNHINEQILENEKYHTIVESLSDGIILFNTETSIVAANSKAAEMFGVTLDELLQNKMIDPDWEIFTSDYKPFLPEDYPSVITLKTSKAVDNVVMGVKNPNGKKLWVSINSRPIFDEKNQLEYIVVATKDITEQEIAKRKLEESELLFSTFFYNTTSACAIYDENNFVIKGNKEFFNAIGVAATEKPVAIKDIFTNESAIEIINRNTSFFKDPTQSRSPFQIVTKNGTTSKYLLTLNLLHIDGKKYIAAHATDVTELSNAEAKIKLMNERLNYVAKVSTDAFWDYNLITKEVYRSENFLTLTGYENSAFVNTNNWWHFNIHPDDQSRVKSYIQNTIKEGKEGWSLEYRFRYANGNYHYILDNGYIIYNNNEAIRAVGSIKDINTQVQLKQQLIDQKIQQEKLITQAAIKAQEEERNNISGELHDNVNQLLMSAKIHLGMLKQSKTLNTEFVDTAVKYILMAVEEIRALCQKLNNSTVKTMGLQKSIMDVCNLLKFNNDTNSNIDIDETLIPELSHEKQLVIFRIIQEQTSNIIKHANAQNVAVSLKKAGTQCELIIEDDGKGLDTSQIKKKGIGFINISSRVNAYNGNVTIENGPEKGVILRASLPIQSITSSASLIN